VRSLLLLLAVALPLAACGSSKDSASEPETRLEVTVWPAGKQGPSKTHTVACPGAAICDRLAQLDPSAFDPVPEDLACTQIFGGADEAHVEGTLGGQPVAADFNRTNGCEIARWNRLAFLLGSAG
jgi:hypothetical protein